MTSKQLAGATMAERRLQVVSFFLIGVYLVVRFIFNKQLDEWGVYASYFFEGSFTLACLILFRKQIRYVPQPSKALALQILLSFGFGYTVYRVATLQNILIPFDLSNTETIVFLIVIGPVLEELLFRQAIWDLAQTLTKRMWVGYVASVLLFTFGHFFAYFYVPDTLKSFIVFQTIYVFIIAVWWGLTLVKKRVIGKTILFHIFFNMGFFLAYRFQ